MSEILDNETGEMLPVETVSISPLVAAEINQQIATAKQYPRRADSQISNEILGRAALNEEVAMECQYALPRGNKTVEGPSIRFAEIVQASYGNIRVAARFVRIDQDDPTKAAVIVEAVAHDLQTNSAGIIPIRRSIMTSDRRGSRPTMYNADMINMTVNAASSLARRNAILSVVPKSIWLPGYQRVIKVLQGDANTLAARRKQVFEAFSRMKVEAQPVLAVLGVPSIDDVMVEHLPTLMGMLNALRDGESIASVLNTHAGSDEVHQKVANPLKDDPISSGPISTGNQRQAPREEPASGGADQTKPQTAEKPQQKVEERREPAPDTSEATAQKADQKAAEGPNAGPAQPAGAISEAGGSKAPAPSGKAAPAASQPLPDWHEADDPAAAYIEHMQDAFDRATSEAAIRDLWSKTREDRRELLGPDQIDKLEKDKTLATNRIKGKAV